MSKTATKEEPIPMMSEEGLFALYDAAMCDPCQRTEVCGYSVSVVTRLLLECRRARHFEEFYKKECGK